MCHKFNIHAPHCTWGGMLEHTNYWQEKKNTFGDSHTQEDLITKQDNYK